MRITLLAVGRLREPWVRAGCDDYLRRLRPRLPIEVVEVRSVKNLERHVPARHLLWGLDEHGEEPTSVELAGRLREAQLAGAPGLVLLIGGPDGLPAPVLAGAQRRLALSRLTLPHRLVRVLLLEQLYRAVSILNGEPYHRE